MWDRNRTSGTKGRLVPDESGERWTGATGDGSPVVLTVRSEKAIDVALGFLDHEVNTGVSCKILSKTRFFLVKAIEMNGGRKARCRENITGQSWPPSTPRPVCPFAEWNRVPGAMPRDLIVEPQ